MYPRTIYSLQIFSLHIRRSLGDHGGDDLDTDGLAATIGLGQYAAAIAMTLIVLAIVNIADLLEERGILSKKESETERDQL